jgi:hypothetical protein
MRVANVVAPTPGKLRASGEFVGAVRTGRHRSSSYKPSKDSQLVSQSKRKYQDRYRYRYYYLTVTSTRVVYTPPAARAFMQRKLCKT